MDSDSSYSPINWLAYRREEGAYSYGKTDEEREETGRHILITEGLAKELETLDQRPIFLLNDDDLIELAYRIVDRIGQSTFDDIADDVNEELRSEASNLDGFEHADQLRECVGNYIIEEELSMSVINELAHQIANEKIDDQIDTQDPNQKDQLKIDPRGVDLGEEDDSYFAPPATRVT